VGLNLPLRQYAQQPPRTGPPESSGFCFKQTPFFFLIRFPLGFRLRLSQYNSPNPPPKTAIHFHSAAVRSPEQREARCFCFNNTQNDGVCSSIPKLYLYFHQVDFRAKGLPVKLSAHLVQLVADIACSPRDPLLCPSVLIILHSIGFLLVTFQMGITRRTGLRKEAEFETPPDRP